MSAICEIDVCEQPTSVCRIRPQDFDLSSCGVPQVPSNAKFIDLHAAFLYTATINAADPPLLDEKKHVNANADFYLFNIRPVTQAGSLDYFVRFQWPNGRYSSPVRQDVRTWGPAITPNIIRVPAGRWIGIEIDYGTSGADPKNIVIAFEGVERLYLR